MYQNIETGNHCSILQKSDLVITQKRVTKKHYFPEPILSICSVPIMLSVSQSTYHTNFCERKINFLKVGYMSWISFCHDPTFYDYGDIFRFVTVLGHRTLIFYILEAAVAGAPPRKRICINLMDLYKSLKLIQILFFGRAPATSDSSQFLIRQYMRIRKRLVVIESA